MPSLTSTPSILMRSLGIACTFLASTTLEVKGAETIQFFVGPFEPTIYIEDLETFAAEGTIPDRLAPIAGRFDAAQLGSIRTLLSTPYPLELVAISQFTYGAFGEQLLFQAGQVVQTDSFMNGGIALRASLLLAAANEPECCTVLDILRHYPLETIQLNLFLLLQIAEENKRIFQLRDEVVAGVREIAVEQVQADGRVILPNYAPHLPGRHRWQRQTLTFQNPGRLQPSLADLYLPDREATTAAKTPVVIISHGIASDRETFAYLAEHLASHGYGVITLEHAETSAEKFQRFLKGMEGPPEPVDLLNRPRDITAVLDTLTQRAATEPDLQALDLSAVGVLGQSLGGFTVLAAGGAQIDQAGLAAHCAQTLAERPSVNLSLLLQCRILEVPEDTSLAVQDDRVKAVIAVNPVTSSLFGQTGLSQLQTPVLIVGGSNDYFAPIVPEQIMPFTWFTHEESYLLIMEYGTHFSFLGAPGTGAFPVPPALIGPAPELARPHLMGLSVGFFNRYLCDRREDEAFLSQTYLATLPQEPFHFDIIHNFFE